MTTHYVDIRVRPDPETSAPQLLGALYGRLHLALVRERLDTIGVSFPGYSLTPRALGNVLRLHANQEVLHTFLNADWLGGVRDHVRVSDIAPVPETASHRAVRRQQFKTNVDRLRRRRMKRKGETATEAAAAIPRTVERRPHLPYVHLRSRSTAQPFCLFIALGAPLTTPIHGEFNTYGLSTHATVPWF